MTSWKSQKVKIVSVVVWLSFCALTLVSRYLGWNDIWSIAFVGMLLVMNIFLHINDGKP